VVVGQQVERLARRVLLGLKVERMLDARVVALVFELGGLVLGLWKIDGCAERETKRMGAYRALGTVVLQKVDSVCAAPLYLMLIFVPVAAVLERGVCIEGKREMRRRRA